MSLYFSPPAGKLRMLFAGFLTLVVCILIVTGVLAKNGLLDLAARIISSEGWTLSSSQPDPPIQLSREYIYAGSRLLTIEDANASATAPADLAVWRPSTGTWWVMGGSSSQQTVQTWGTSGDKPVPGDYDGDGKTDFSIYRPSSGQWYVLQSSDNAWAPVIAWGTPTDVRVPADFDGDGRTDRAVWRPSDGIWYIVRSSNGASSYQSYGINGDKPAPADYDGDGRADLAVWRNSNRTFYSINSSNGANRNVSFATSGTEPVSADYDGDGRADHAIRNGSSWIIRQSSNSQTVTVAWQQSTDIAVRNDYDGDGKCDIAVWRSANSPAGTSGNWFIRQSALGNSLRQVQWGASGDIPVPALYRR